ncbi:MAG: S9 family peptidase, partial [Acidobacteria bacterium]|nr:S9 family peptidase [Acidobacteriota bacterium]
MQSTRTFILIGLLFTLSFPPSSAQSPAKRPLRLEDLARIRGVSEPEISPEGDWVAYTVETTDLKEDKKGSDIWMTRWNGRETIQLTSSKESESKPRWSPDGRYLAFLAARGGEEELSQVFLLNRSGGEAVKLTDLPSGVSDFAWAPDGKRLALVASDPDPDASSAKKEPGEKKPPKPIVIDRYQFKQDVSGYLTSRQKHLYLFDLVSKKAEPLTAGAFSDGLPSWSPEGTRIAFASKRGPDPDRHSNSDVFVIESRAGAPER